MNKLVTLAVVCFLGIAPALHAEEPVDMAAAAKALDAMTWYSEEYPPYNFMQDGHLTGMSVDILDAAFRKIGAKTQARDIQVVPWNRSYKFVQRKPGTALFSMTYTPEREKLMKFVGPAVPTRIAVLAPKAAGLKGKLPKQLDQIRIGVVRDDIGDQLLRQHAISDDAIQRKNSLKQLMYLMKSGRIDAVSYAVDVFNFAVKSGEGDPGKYEEVLLLQEGAMGYAFHKSADPAVLAHLQTAIDDLRNEGVIDAIISSYTQ